MGRGDYGGRRGCIGVGDYGGRKGCIGVGDNPMNLSTCLCVHAFEGFFMRRCMCLFSCCG